MTAHPWDRTALSLILDQITKVASLFKQRAARRDREGLIRTPEIGLRLFYDEVLHSQVGPEFDQKSPSYSFSSEISWKTSSGDSIGKTLKLVVYQSKRGCDAATVKFFAFLQEELNEQFALGFDFDCYRRPDWGQRAPLTWDERAWDLRVRLIDFLRRFLHIYRSELQPDPFTSFFLRPYRSSRTDAQQTRSGFFGYEYLLDGGQRDYLKAQGIEFPEELQLPFPYGVCAEVFLSGRASRPHDVGAVRDQYPPEAQAVSEFERKVLDGGILIEIPVYAPGVGDGRTDGPELIVTVRLPKQSSPSVEPPAPTLADQAEVMIAKSLASRSAEVLDPGEGQIISEICQRLISIYFRATVPEQSTSTIVVVSPAMRDIQRRYLQAATNDRSILLLGASGTGKTTIARDIHDHSSRKGRVFGWMSAANIQNDLAASQLFGHRKGAFTGADQPRPGLLETVNGGTLFLDDIDGLDRAVQVRLLSFIDSGEFHRLGDESAGPVKSNVRLICATNRMPNTKEWAEIFRDDFVNRIKRQVILIPPLRERPADIPKLIEYFVMAGYKLNGLTGPPTINDSFIARATEEPWDNGQLRQLRDAVENAMVEVGEDGMLTAEVLDRVLNADPFRLPKIDNAG